MIVITFASNSSKVQSNAQSKIKNAVIIIVKLCIICEKRYHTTSKHRDQLNYKRDRDQFDERKDDRDNKRKRKNDIDNDNDDERNHSDVNDENNEHKVYIVINFETLIVMSVMSRQVTY
jgi:hypothetical protein